MTYSKYFQDHMPGNVCFGCGSNHNGLQIRSFWEEDVAVCRWTSKDFFHGWRGLMNGGIMATLIDCHCMGTAMAHAYKSESRELNSEPEYRYATGTLTIKYLKPTPNDYVELHAKVVEAKGRKTVMTCELISSKEEVTVTADVIAIRVFDSRVDSENIFNS